MRVPGAIWGHHRPTGRHLDLSTGLVVALLALLWLALGVFLVLVFL